MKQINLVNMQIDACMDADDLGQRLVECSRAAIVDTNVVNLIKIHVGANMPMYALSEFLNNSLARPLKEMGITNCIYVPIKEGFINDITIDRIEVSADESNS